MSIDRQPGDRQPGDGQPGDRQPGDRQPDEGHPGGETVVAWIERLGALPERNIIEIARQMAAVLERAFAENVPPQAMTPAHITVNRDGVAEVVGEVTEPAGPALDSRHYASPERAKGEAEPDIRSDIYSLGASLYHMATGRVPFGGDTVAAAMSGHVTGRLPWPSDVNAAISARLSQIIAKMMAKDPEDRYRTPAELSLDLDIVRQGRDPVIAGDAPPDSTVASPRELPRAKTAEPPSRPVVDLITGVVDPTGPRGIKAEKARPPGLPPGKRPLARRPSSTVRMRPAERRGLKRWFGPSGEAKRRAEQAKLVAAIGSGVVVALLLVVLAVLSGGPGREPSVGKPGAGEPEYEVARAVRAADELRAMDALNVAKKHALDHPDEFEEALEKFKHALLLAGGTSLEEEAAAATQAHRARRKERAYAVLAAAEKKAKRLAAAGDYDGGSVALMDLDPKLSPQVGSELIQVTTKLASEGRKRIATVLAEAEGFAEAGLTERARAKLKELDRIRFKVGLAEVAPRRQALLKRMAEAEQVAEEARREARERATEQLPALLARFNSLVEAGELAGARVLMDDSAARQENKEARLGCSLGAEAFRAASRVARALEERREIMLAAARECAGETFTLQTLAGPRKGRLESAGAQGLELVTQVIMDGEVRSETRHSLTWAEIDPEEADRLAEGWEPEGPDDLLARAVIALGRKDAEAARRALGAAGDHPLVPYYRERAEALKPETTPADRLAP